MLLHQIFEDQVLRHPERIAIEFQGTNITYAELNIASNKLAAHIRRVEGVESGMIALSLEKGPLMVKAVLAVLKAGIAWVPLQLDAPPARLRMLLDAIGPGLILTSRATSHVTDGLGRAVVLDDCCIEAHIQQQSGENLPGTERHIQPDDLCHVLFTSGSTGVPKGVMIEHQAVVHNVRILTELFGLNEKTRTLQFAAYTFDIFGLDLFMTFAAGGCLIMGSLEEMMCDLTGFVNRTHVNYAQLTPTIISLLEVDKASSLQVLASSGETLTPGILDRWASRVDLFNAYGPTETIVCTVQRMTTALPLEPQHIGTSIDGLDVILVREDSTEEAAIGTMGEICVSGIQLFRGYLGLDSGNESRCFLHRGHQKFYRTGDLGVLNQLSDSSQTIRLLGRRDRQDKIHGVRVDVGEVETALGSFALTRQCLAIIPKAGPAHGRIAAILSVSRTETWDHIETLVAGMHVYQPTCAAQKEVLGNLSSQVRTILPPHAVPSTWFIIDNFPLTASGKIDQRKIKQWLESMTEHQFGQYTQSWVTRTGEPAHTDSESEYPLQRQLIDLCSSAIGLSPVAIDPQVPLLQIGFDSLAIFRLVSMARRSGLDLGIQHVLRGNSVAQLASFLKRRYYPRNLASNDDSASFDMIPADVDGQELRGIVSKQCGVKPEAILDIYPCTPLQHGMMALAARHPGSYICNMSFTLSSTVNQTRFVKAWELLLSTSTLLRTRVVHGMGGVDLFQAVVSSVSVSNDEPFNAPMSFGDSLCRGRVIWNDADRTWKFELKIHHALIDGWAKDLLLLQLRHLYDSNGQPTPTSETFKTYITFLVGDINRRADEHASFWRSYLDGCVITMFPPMPSDWTGEIASKHTLLNHSISVDVPMIARRYRVTSTTIVQVAWALNIGKHTGTSDVVFGATLSGRNVPVEDIDRIIGPTMITVPIRSRWEETETLGQLIQQCHQASINMLPHQHYGLQNIGDTGSDSKNACLFRSLLVVQPEAATDNGLSGFMTENNQSNYELLRTYPVSIEFILSSSQGAKIRAHYDQMAISKEDMVNVLDHLESLLCQLYRTNPEALVGDAVLVREGCTREEALASGGQNKQVTEQYPGAHMQEETVSDPDRSRAIWTAQERWVCEIWQDLFVTNTSFALCDNFFKVGGDSILTIRLVLACRKRGLHISVPQIYENPTLKQMATLIGGNDNRKSSSCSISSSSQAEPPAPFSLATGNLQEVLTEVASICDIQVQDIEDVLPASPFQEGLAAINIVAEAAYMAKWVFSLPNDIDIRRLREAMETLVARNPILRTALAHSSHGTVQAVIKMSEWLKYRAAQRGSEPHIRVESNKGLFDYLLYSDLRGDTVNLQINIHHILYDEWTMQFLLDDLAYNYSHPGAERLGRPGYSNFIRHIANLGHDKFNDSIHFWERDLEGTKELEFPRAPSGRPFRTNAVVELPGPMEPTWARQKHMSVTPAAITAAALAILLSSYSSSQEATFGLTLSGRDVAGLEDICGPTISTVPLRISPRPDQEAAAFVRAVQSKMRALQVHQHVGLQRIAKLGTKGPRNACAFRTLFVAQEGSLKPSSVDNTLHFTLVEDKTSITLNYGLVVILTSGRPDEGIKLKIEYDAECLSEQHANHILKQLTQIIRQLSCTTEMIGHIKVARPPGDEDMAQTRHVQAISVHPDLEVNDQAKEKMESSLAIHLRKLWGEVLDLTPEDIRMDDNIIKLGGDSITLIRLASAARKLGFQFSIGSQIDQYMTLADMSSRLTATWSQFTSSTSSGVTEPLAPLPFSLIEGMSKDACIRDAAAKCSVVPTSIIDVYPCTSLQEGLMALSSSEPGSYLVQHCYKIVGDVDSTRLEHALRHVWQTEPILRTRIFVNLRLETVQAVIDEPVFPFSIHRHDRTLKCFLARDKEALFEYGRPLTRFSLVFPSRETLHLVISQHHAISDGWSLGIMIDAIKKRYSEGAGVAREPAGCHIPSFVKFARNVQESSQAAQFWETALDGARVTEFPPLGRQNTFQAKYWARTSCGILSPLKVPLPTLLEAAWGLVLSKIVGCEDVCFGVVRSGRTSPIYQIEAMMGPTIATIPRRMTPRVGLTASEYLDQALSLSNKAVPYEQFGLSKMALLGPSIREACNFRTLLVVQPKATIPLAQHVPGHLILEPIDDESMHGTYGLIVDCEPQKDGTLSIHVNFDTTSISAVAVGWVSDYFTSAISQLGGMPNTLLGEIDVFGPRDRASFLSLIKQREPARELTTSNGAGTVRQRLSGNGEFGVQDGVVLNLAQEEPRNTTSGNDAQKWSILRQLWADVLHIDPKTIELDDDFMLFGGDSIVAIKLSSRARDKSISLSARSVLQNPVFEDMARYIDVQQIHIYQKEPSVPLADVDNKPNLVSQVSEMSGMANGDIEDVYPCTPLQTNLMALTLRHPGSYSATETFQLLPATNVERFIKSWDLVYQRHDMLRTRIYQVFNERGQATLVQAVCVEKKAPWQTISSEQQFESDEMGLGTPLARFRLLRTPEGVTHFKITRHHAIYDGWSTALLWADFRQAYEGGSMTIRPPFKHYAQFLQGLDGRAAAGFWKEALNGYSAEHYPYALRDNASTRLEATSTSMELFGRTEDDAKTLGFPTLAKAAWALTLATVGRGPSRSHDICFGSVVSGRMDPLAAIEDIAGPTMSTIPVRVKVDIEEPVGRYLGRVAERAKAMMGFEYVGLRSIGQTSEFAKVACQFQNLLVVQTPENGFPTGTNGTDYVCEAVGSDGISQPYGLILECTRLAGSHRFRLNATFDENRLPASEVRVALRQLSRTMQLLSDSTRRDTPLGKLLQNLATVEDYHVMESFNGPTLSKVPLCLHELVEKSARVNPYHAAIHSHDKDLTYEELNNTSSRLAIQLQQNFGVGVGTLVPICFEKSSFMIVAILAIMKAGGGYVPLDPSHPSMRLKVVVDQCRTHLILVSSVQNLRGTCAGVGVETLVVGSDLLDAGHADPRARLAPITPDDVAYVIFTSGSTGRPKGVVMSHGSVGLTLMQYEKVFDWRACKRFRTLQFSSYTFDVSVAEIFGTLAFGGTLCIPREEDRLTDLARVITTMGVGIAFLTPTMAKTIEPQDVSTLEMLCFTGEALPASLGQTWAGSTKTKVFNAYGPTEVAIHCAAVRIETDTPPRSIGSPFGGQLWITDLSDHNKLQPVGCAGELVVSGATLAQGYLNNVEETRKAFIDNVSWFESIPARRIYKTGDVARFRGDGTIEFLGRRNSRQVKLHGLRIELGEIEAALHSFGGNGAFSDAMVEKLTIGANDALVAFFLSRPMPVAGGELQHVITPLSNFSQEMKRLVRLALKSLQASIPSHSIPSLFLPISRWPQTAAGKIDRQCLRRAAESLPALSVYKYRDIDEGSVENQPTAKGDPRRNGTNAEQHQANHLLSPALIQDMVAKLWRKTLGLDASFPLESASDFFSSGGDSVSAIFLVANFRREDIQLTVGELYQRRTIAGMVDLVSSRLESGVGRESHSRVLQHNQPFSLLPAKDERLERLLEEVAAELEVSPNSIDDIYPCLPLQEGLMFLTEKVAGSYHAHLHLLMPRRLDVERLSIALRRLIETHPILRTRIIFHSTLGSLQVVLSPSSYFSHSATRPDTSNENESARFGYGLPLHRHALVAHGERIFLDLDCHHSIYDGWTLSLLVQDLCRLYHNVQAPREHVTSPFQEVIAYSRNPEVTRATDEFWEKNLQGAVVSNFPDLAGSTYEAIHATAYYEHCFRVSCHKRSNGYTMATVLIAAWSLVVSRYTGSDHVCFGLLVSGRNAPIPGIEGIMGPTINTVPFRTAIEAHSMTVGALLERVQSHMVDMIPHQFANLRTLQKLFTDGRGEFGSLISIQSETATDHNQVAEGCGPEFSIQSVSTGQDQTPAIFGEPYPLFIEGKIDKAGDTVCLGVQYDPEILSVYRINGILQQYEMAICLLADAENDKACVANISQLSESEEQLLRDWAGPLVQPGDICVHEMIEKIATGNPHHQAIEGFDESLTYEELEEQACSLANQLAELTKERIKPAVNIPVWMENSPTAVIAILAIFKLGACYVPLDSRIPITRAEYIVGDVAADMMLVSKSKVAAAKRLAADMGHKNKTLQIIQIDEAMAAMKAMETRPNRRLLADKPSARTSDLAYIIYTSGSTGQPKGVMMEHWALTATVKEQAITYGFDLSTRMFGLANLGWDPSLLEIFAILSHGGCLCVPTDAERSGCHELVDSINRHRADQISTSPAMASLIDLRRTPTVRAISLGGEVLRQENIRNAHEAGVRLFNIYGPSEACIDAVVHRRVVPGVSTRNIGRPMSSRAWIVDPSDPRRLVPPGCPGELALSGTLARGYLNDEVKTARSFLSDCPFAAPVYLTGDLARYEADGSLHFLGRKDRQIKLNGQRVELGDIETAVKSFYPWHDVVADYITMPPDSANSLLIVFIAAKSSSSTSSSTACAAKDIGNHAFPVVVESRMRPDSEEFQRLQEHLRSLLPRYMVPRVFATVSHLPLSNADKVDGKALRAAYTEWLETPEVNHKSNTGPGLLTVSALSTPHVPSLASSLAPRAQSEAILRSLWALVVGGREERIQPEDDFFDLGADSLSVMKLTFHARQRGFRISVADVYAQPTLSQMARLLQIKELRGAPSFGVDPDGPMPFSLLPSLDCRRSESGMADIVDMFPCTSFQAASLIQGHKRHKAFYAWFVVQIKGGLDTKRLQGACDLLIHRHAVLRTSYHVADGTFLQQVHGPANAAADIRDLGYCSSVEAMLVSLHHDVPNPVTLGRILTRFRMAAHSDDRGENSLLAIGMSHAQYDGFCWSTILNDLQHAYRGEVEREAAQPSPPYSRFVGHTIQTLRNPATEEFWAELLRGSKMSSFAPQIEKPRPRRVLMGKQVATLPGYHLRPGNFTFAVVFKTAWSMVLSWLLKMDDVVIGSLVFGRDPQIDGIGEMVGACINVVPNRVLFLAGGVRTLADVLSNVRRQQASIVPFESTPLAAVCQHAGWKPWTRFGSIVQHQNFDEGVFAAAAAAAPGVAAASDDSCWSFEGSASYPGLCDDVDCWVTSVPKPDQVEIQFQYSSAVIPDDCAADIVQMLCGVVRAIYTDGPSLPVQSFRPAQEAISSLQSRLLQAQSTLTLGDPKVDSAMQNSRQELQEGCTQGHEEEEEDSSVLSRLRKLWAAALPPSAGPKVGNDDDASFFTLGGDSTRVVQLAVSCEQAGLLLGVQEAFDYPTLRLQAAYLCGKFGPRHQTKEDVRLVLEA